MQEKPIKKKEQNSGRRGVERIQISSSIENFREKLLHRTGLQEYHQIWDIRKKVLFAGLYHPVDYLRFIFHRGKRVLFWCGSDIKALSHKKAWIYILARTKARHICENATEQEELLKMEIKAEIYPMIFAEPMVKVAYPKYETRHVFMCCPNGREEEYGVKLIDLMGPTFDKIVFHIYGTDWKMSHDNIRYHGQVSAKQFERDIEQYHCGLRLNEFDGFSEVTARSTLLAQHPISRMWYPHITWAPTVGDLIRELKKLNKKKKPNLNAQKYWADRLEKSLCEVLS